MDELTKVVAEEVVEKAAEETAKKTGESLAKTGLIGGVCFIAGAAVGWFGNKLFGGKKAEKSADQDFMNDIDDEVEEVKED